MSLAPPPIPEAFAPARRLARTLLHPIEQFLHVQAASGLLLLAASVTALVWANSPWHLAYDRLWHVPVVVGVGPLQSVQPLDFWINDGLMVVFFFVVGLEIRREIHEGGLSDLRRAALPVAAAIGGMIAPALIYLAVNPLPPARLGWGAPMATDIAFAVGALALLGKRVPAGVRVLLLALAIIDDIGAILVIAVFYSRGVSLVGIEIAAAGLAILLLLRMTGVRRSIAYVIPGAVLWWGLLRAGIHPTLAGVVLGLLTPARPWYGEAGFLQATEGAVAEIRALVSSSHSHHDLLAPLAQVAEARREAVPPVVRLEAALHPWVAYGIMPIFALANAGVYLGDVDLGALASGRVALGVVAGLCLGKPIGILATTFVAVKARVAALPRGVSWRGMTVIGLVAGVGFTMALFIADLAFEGRELAAAKLGVLVASAISGAVALAFGRALLPRVSGAAATETPLEAESVRG